MQLTEKDYNELNKYALNIARKYVGYKEEAFDIAQNVMLTFLSSKKPITSPYSWIRIVTKRESEKFFDETKKNQKLVAQVKSELATATLKDEDENQELNFYSIDKLKRILSKEDFRIFKKLKKAEFSIAKFSKQEHLTYAAASTLKKRIKRNIIAAKVEEEGWKYSTKILNYSSYKNISRFINNLIHSVNNKKTHELRNYLLKIDKSAIDNLFNDVVQCVEWTISLKNNLYNLSLICMTQKQTLKFLQLLLEFDLKKYIVVNDAVEMPCIYHDKGSIDEISRYTDKGKLILSKNEVISVISNNKSDS